MRFIRNSFTGIVITLLFVSFFITAVYAAATWLEVQPGGDFELAWTPSAMSSDGQKMIVGEQGGTLYLSSDKGSSWEVIDPSGGAEAPDWLTTSMSSNGQIILAGIYGGGGRLYRSTDGGSNWSEIRPAGNSDHDWGATSMSSNGQIMLAGTRNNGRLYKSTNGGTNWSEVQPAGDTDVSWGSSNMSSNGQIMVVGAINGRLYLSTNVGSNWSEIQPAGDEDQQWYSVGMSSNGQVILVGDAYSLFLSKNTADTWSQVYPAGDTEKRWPISSVSSDGQTMFVGGEDRIYLSTDGGDTWPQVQPAGNVDFDWALGSMSSDSQTLLAGVYNGRLYLGLNTPNPSSGGGGSSSSSSSSTPTCSTTPNGAPNLFQINTTKNSANLFFSPVADATNYQISYGFNSNANEFSVLTNQDPSTGVLSFVINSLPALSNVYFKVYAQNNCGQGNWSNAMQVKTSGGVYYKSIISQIVSAIVPQKATALKQTPVKTVTTQANTAPVKPVEQIKPKINTVGQVAKPQSVAGSPKKSCFLFVCW